MPVVIYYDFAVCLGLSHDDRHSHRLGPGNVARIQQ